MATPPRGQNPSDDTSGQQSSSGRPARNQGNDNDPQLPEEQPGLTGGPATEAVPHAGQQLPQDLLKERERTLVAPLPGEENDGGETVLSSVPRETGGERPPKPR